jgi:hypothetical protein
VLCDLRDAHASRDLREHHRPVPAHPRRVARHDAEVGADRLGEIGLVHDEEVRLRDPGTPLARHLVPAGHVDDVDRVVGELAAEVRSEVVAARLAKEDLGPVRLGELLEREQVRGDVLADRCVGAPAGLDCADPLGRQGVVPDEELGVLASEDVVRHDRERARVAERAAEREDERGLPAPHRTAHADGEGAPAEIVARVGCAAVLEGARADAVIVTGVEREFVHGQLWNSLE